MMVRSSSHAASAMAAILLVLLLLHQNVGPSIAAASTTTSSSKISYTIPTSPSSSLSTNATTAVSSHKTVSSKPATAAAAAADSSSMTIPPSTSAKTSTTRAPAVDTTAAVQRPPFVLESLANPNNNTDIYYFGLGSNMLRSKLEGRAVCGTPITIKSMVPAVVKNYRLAFNMRGFLPLEPGMGSLEAISPTTTTTEEDGTENNNNNNNNSKPLVAYTKPECHGALVRLSAADYERVMRSEGVPGSNPATQGYEEVVVEAIPYGSSNDGNYYGKPVQAVALRARDHVRLKQDPAPSRRYMTILQEGAKELGLSPCYQEFLKQHPVAAPWLLTRRIAVLNMVFVSKLSFQYKKLSFLSKIQSWCLWNIYVPPTTKNAALQTLHELATMLVLLPGAIPGSIMFLYMKVCNKLSPMMKLMVDGHW